LLCHFAFLFLPFAFQKVIALEDLDIRSSYNPQIRATGTGTDNAIIVSGEGPRIDYLGGHSKMGELVARAVTSAVKEAIFKQDGIK
jgi:adenosylcobinamide amidohydrolase